MDLVHQFLAVIAPGYHPPDCIMAVVTAISKGHKLLEVHCKRCAQQLVDIGKLAVKARCVQQCPHCGEWTVTSQQGHANPLVRLGPVLVGETLSFT